MRTLFVIQQLIAGFNQKTCAERPKGVLNEVEGRPKEVKASQKSGSGIIRGVGDPRGHRSCF
jgi:hypothetical protein